jgi:hypothetical protein
MLFLGNVGQQLDIGDLEGAIAEMQSAFQERWPICSGRIGS